MKETDAPLSPRAPLVLVIDDEKGIVDVLTIALEKDGYRVVGATSCTDGLRLLEEARPDLVLTDLRMDDGSGFDPDSRGHPGGMGLHIMNYRARSIGGTVRIGREMITGDN